MQVNHFISIIISNELNNYVLYCICMHSVFVRLTDWLTLARSNSTLLLLAHFSTCIPFDVYFFSLNALCIQLLIALAKICLCVRTFSTAKRKWQARNTHAATTHNTSNNRRERIMNIRKKKLQKPSRNYEYYLISPAYFQLDSVCVCVHAVTDMNANRIEMKKMKHQKHNCWYNLIITTKLTT